MTTRALAAFGVLYILLLATAGLPNAAAQSPPPAATPDKLPGEAEYEELVRQSKSEFVIRKFACFLGDGKWKGNFNRGVTLKSLRNDIPAPFSLKNLDRTGVFTNVKAFVDVARSKLNYDRPPCLVTYTLETKEGREQATKDMELFAKLAPIWAQDGEMLKP